MSRRVCRAVVAILAVAAIGGCRLGARCDPALQQPVPAAQAEWEAALAALDRGDLPQAVARLRAVRETSPRFVRAHLLYQDTMIALGKETEVRQEYQGMGVGQEHERNQEPSALWHALGARLADDADRIPQLESAVEADPGLAWAHFGLGFERLYRADREQAEIHLRRAVALDPDLPEARLALARLHFRNGDEAAAVKQYEHYLQLCPKDALHWLKYGMAVGDEERAFHAYATVLTIAPEELERAIHRRDVVLTLEQLRRYEQRCSLRYAARVNLSEILMARGKYPKAVSVLEEAVAENAECPDAHFNLGIAYENLARLTAGTEARGAGRASAFSEQAAHHWTRYLALGGEQRERVRGWLADLQGRSAGRPPDHRE